MTLHYIFYVYQEEPKIVEKEKHNSIKLKTSNLNDVVFVYEHVTRTIMVFKKSPSSDMCDDFEKLLFSIPKVRRRDYRTLVKSMEFGNWMGFINTILKLFPDFSILATPSTVSNTVVETLIGMSGFVFTLRYETHCEKRKINYDYLGGMLIITDAYVIYLNNTMRVVACGINFDNNRKYLMWADRVRPGDQLYPHSNIEVYLRALRTRRTVITWVTTIDGTPVLFDKTTDLTIAPNGRRVRATRSISVNDNVSRHIRINGCEAGIVYLVACTRISCLLDEIKNTVYYAPDCFKAFRETNAIIDALRIVPKFDNTILDYANNWKTLEGREFFSMTYNLYVDMQKVLHTARKLFEKWYCERHGHGAFMQSRPMNDKERDWEHRVLKAIMSANGPNNPQNISISADQFVCR